MHHGQIGQYQAKYMTKIQKDYAMYFTTMLQWYYWGHGGRVVTLWPHTTQVGKLVVACRWSAVYSTES